MSKIFTTSLSGMHQSYRLKKEKYLFSSSKNKANQIIGTGHAVGGNGTFQALHCVIYGQARGQLQTGEGKIREK